jgi:hypothetical protein
MQAVIRSVISVPMASRASTAMPRGVCRLHVTQGLLSSRPSSSLAGKSAVAMAADNVRARWLKLGGEGSSESYSSLVGSSGSASNTTGSSPVCATVPAYRQQQRPSPMYSLRRVATGGPAGPYAPMTQAGRMPVLPEVATATWRELRRAQMAADDFETFI